MYHRTGSCTAHPEARTGRGRRMRGGGKSKSSCLAKQAQRPLDPARMPICHAPALRLAPRCTSNSTSQLPLHVLGRLHHVVYTLLSKGTQPARLVRQLSRLIPCFARLLAQERLLVLGLERNGHLRLRTVLVVLKLFPLARQIILGPM